MVTGTYYPEISGASLQCRQIVRALAARAEFLVLTTTTNPKLTANDVVDGVDVARVYVDPTSAVSKALAGVRMASILSRLRSRFDIVHLHGVSQKSILVVWLARVFGKRVFIKLTSFGHDDAISMRGRGAFAFRFYAAADRFIAVSPRFEAAHRDAGLPVSRFRLVPNGVDLTRFVPVDAAERSRLRATLGLPAGDPIVLFVGFFSHEKRPDLLYRAWRGLVTGGLASTLVLVGASQSTYYEIDPGLSRAIRDDAQRRGLSSRLVFVEHTTDIAKYYQAADLFALPTLREGLPNVLLEAMASGLPPVITRLPGVTDWIVEDGVTGLLVPPNDEAAMADALSKLLGDEDLRRSMGRAARQTVVDRFDAGETARRTLDVYLEGG